MPDWETRLKLTHPFEGVRPHLLEASLLKRWLDAFGRPSPTVDVVDASPGDAYPGTAMVISGHNFSSVRADNTVTVGGKNALVVEADPNRLFVLTDTTCSSGPIEVTVGGTTALAPHDFRARPWPGPGGTDPAPPFNFDGKGLPGSGPGATPPGGSPGGAAAGTIPPTGTARVLVAIANPTDKTPPAGTATRDAIVTTFDNVTTFYDQVSYGTLNVVVDVTDWIPLLDDAAYYHRANSAGGYPNIDWSVHTQLEAEAAQGAVDQGYDLDDYAVFAILVYMPGLSVRAWGGWSEQNFAYNDGAGTAINVVAANPLSMILARHDADWGRAAHEFGHSLVDAGLVLGEDVYASDLVDSSQATASSFEMMGSHDSHPMFSGVFMEQLGYYSGANIATRQWNRNPFSEEFDIVAHGDAADTTSAFNLVRITVSPGLDYYVEVRQRPPAGSSQVYDTNIPIPTGSTRTGGVVVTKVISDVVNNNQETRFVTLLHDPEVLLTGDVATDPLRGLVITVLDDQKSTNPLACRVKVEWAQQIGDTPGGDFDLSITPWGAGWETFDIWVDRMPYGSYDFTDPSGNPTGNGDEPRPMEINRFWARVNNAGIAVTDVRLTYYAVTPPGVGDNGTWTPLQTKVIPNVASDGSATDYVNWIPTVGEHTCLKVVAEQQLGEVTGGNNSAQENVFNFQPAASSVPEPVALPVAIRNPLDEPADVLIRVQGVPKGYRVYLPYRWVSLPPRGEQRMDLIIVPTDDYQDLRKTMESVRREFIEQGVDPAAHVRVSGDIHRGYLDPVDGEVPGSWFMSIGGITARVEPKARGTVEIKEDDRERDPDTIRVRGQVRPELGGQVLRVDCRGTDGTEHYAVATTDEAGRFVAEFSVGRRTEPTDDQEEKRQADEANLAEQGTVEVAEDAVARREVGKLELARRPGRLGHLERLLARRPVIFEVQAHVFNARDLAPASSNVVWVDRPA